MNSTGSGVEWRGASAGDEGHALPPGRIEGSKQCNLSLRTQAFHIIHCKQEGRCFRKGVGHLGRLDVTGRPAGLGRGRDHAAQQMAAPAAGITPQKKVLGHIGDGNRLVESGEKVGVGRGDEVLQQRWCVGVQIESELLHGVVLPFNTRQGQAGDISAKIRVCLREDVGNVRLFVVQGPLM